MTALQPGAPEDVGLDPARIDLARRMLHTHVESGRAPSAAAVVARHGTVVLAEVAGVQRPDGPDLALDHLWPLASATKPLTAATVLTLVEEGRLGINEAVVDHLPELAGSTHDEVLVHHLLTHTAGWESPMFTGRIVELMEAGGPGEPPPGRDPISHLFLTLAFDPVRACPPGERMDYANVNYELLAEIVRRITGDTLSAAMEERVLRPLGMGRSALVVPDDLRPDLVQRAPGLPGGPDDVMTLEGAVMEGCDAGGAGGFASPLDLARFAQAILQGGELDGRRVLAPSTVAAMVTDQIPGTPAKFGPDRLIPRGSWGYGFSVVCEQRWPWFGGGLVPDGTVTHPGAGGVNYWIDPTNEIVGVWFEVLTEMSPFNEPLSGLSHRFQDVITGAIVE